MKIPNPDRFYSQNLAKRYLKEYPLRCKRVETRRMDRRFPALKIGEKGSAGGKNEYFQRYL
jgi:hypothetical protein